jgi:hypothetical protein
MHSPEDSAWDANSKERSEELLIDFGKTIDLLSSEAAPLDAWSNVAFAYHRCGNPHAARVVPEAVILMFHVAALMIAPSFAKHESAC